MKRREIKEANEAKEKRICMKKELKLKQLMSLNMIRIGATRYQTYDDGLEYYLTGKVIGFRLDKPDNKLIGIVKGSETYRQVVKFKDVSFTKISDYACTCPAHRSYQGFCKHLVAILIAYSDSGSDMRIEVKSSAPKEIDILKSIIAPETVML